jgi:tetratricopeptide (TPR) repeat protein
VVTGYQAIFGKESRRTLQAEGDFANCLMALGYFHEAEDTAEAALAGERRLDAPDSPAYADAVSRVGRILLYRGAYEAAVPLLREAYRVTQIRHRPTDLDVVAAGYDLARPLMYRRRFAEARALLNVKLPADQTDGYANYLRAMRTRWQGELEMEAGHFADAKRLLSDAERQFSGFKSPDGSVISKLRESQGWLLNLEGRHEQAAAQLRMVGVAYGKWYPADSAYVQIANVQRAAALLALNQKEAARRLLNAAKPVVERELVPGAETRILYLQLARTL